MPSRTRAIGAVNRRFTAHGSLRRRIERAGAREGLPPEGGEVEAEAGEVGMGERVVRTEGADRLVGGFVAAETLQSS